MAEKAKVVAYRFKLSNGLEKTFELRLRLPDVALTTAAPQAQPEWTRLTFHQCPNCPLDPLVHERCPVAAQLVDVAEFFKNVDATETALVVITIDGRELSKTTPVLKALSSLMGLYMAVSGCPVLDKLRPMAFLHLPFSSLEETRYRAIGMYLIAQFLRQRRGLPADFALARLPDLYKEVDRVNAAFFGRLRSIDPRDASLNAIVNLDALAGFTMMTLEQDRLSELEALFAPYL